ncbi:FAD/NAD(P)-binding domain-containing protein [Lentinus tigrinus ALCF2SS1-7]|uniref:FAD/NAD(P)-binding domain-containing protein n=1 Tax=Lentinus tigrinus ALCF2SS1-6 TaxID=1328759 RepID=A0A5C2S5D9_9APHY|nr:FAD/NAD(P)-binding domain-containing protein [Lentinus tigrinus ALCF2SS1-6]RPD72971.1 FAD/NAD(P)-binding domain-containing protein [Lentinus tigrinus ALCF2SS1-7]
MSSTTPATPSKFRVAIVGAGLGGLLLALFLQKYSTDIDVDIYESAAKLTELGAGIGVWPRVMEVLKFLGLEDDLKEIGGAHDSTAQSVHYRKADEPKAVDIRVFAPALLTFSRSDLQAVLAKHLHTADKIVYSKRLLAYVEPEAGQLDPIVLQFKDGTTATCDLLVGSDGIRSAARRTMFNNLADAAEIRGDKEQAAKLRTMIEPVWSGQVVYRGLVPVDKLADSAHSKDLQKTLILLGKDRASLPSLSATNVHEANIDPQDIVSYPITRGKTINVAAFVNTPGAEGTTYTKAWVTESTSAEVLEKFSGWDAGVQDLFKAMDKSLSWAVHTVRGLPTYVSGRAVLIGDAAHAMTPHQGSGAGQAIEDGFILATILSHPNVTLSNLFEALKIHDGLRRPFSQGIQRRSQMTGYLYHLHRLGWEHITGEQSAAGDYPREMLGKIGDELESAMGWAINESIMDDREKALKLLEKL